LSFLLNWQIAEKAKCIFDNMALYFQCRINNSAESTKKRTPSDYFLAFCPLGLSSAALPLEIFFLHSELYEQEQI